MELSDWFVAFEYRLRSMEGLAAEVAKRLAKASEELERFERAVGEVLEGAESGAREEGSDVQR